MKYSPMIMQYLEIKDRYKDYIVFYRLGDFYEMFFDDALTASRELDITLTGRDCGQTEKAPMCGVPFHSADNYIARLVEKGFKIAICEQVSDPKESKGIVKRDVVKIITPGTITETNMLDEEKNNYIGAVYKDQNGIGLAFCDITVGTVFSTQITDDKPSGRAISEISKYMPREVILNKLSADDFKLTWFLKERLNCNIELRDNADFESEKTKDLVGKIKGYGKAVDNLVFCACANLLTYLNETQINNLSNVNQLESYSKAEFMELDLNARRNLELVQTMRDKSKKSSLLWVLDKTKTPMGTRFMRSTVEQPLINATQITKRLNLTEELVQNHPLLDNITDCLKQIRDIERLMGKITYLTAGPKDLKILEQTIGCLPELIRYCSELKCDLGNEITQKIDDLSEIKHIISSSILDDPSTFVRDGNIIKDGYNTDVDDLRALSCGGKEKLMEIEAREKEATGIKTLKIGYNKVFGYYIEVTKSFIDQVPEHYIRKQTLANQERYIIEELKTHENTVISAQDKLIKLEQSIFNDILMQIARFSSTVQQTAKFIAMIDVISSFANVAIENDYVKPHINLSDRIDIVDGRHPVVERVLKDDRFVPNDTILNTSFDKISVITGPNMAGKSTYMRQVAVIVIMAQIGSFVPAKSAEIGIVDKVFTRVGASDDLATGQSTFMVEMNEVSDVLNNATSKSLVILDEIGRGTSTFDGLSIARSVTEFILKNIGCKTLLSTHYHELTDLEQEFDGIKNYNIAVKKNGDEVIFLRKIVRGGTDQSYGIAVAKLAGIPDAVTKRAKEILHSLENEGTRTVFVSKTEEEPQISMTNNDEITKLISSIDINTLTPIEAMNTIFKLQKML